MKVITKRIVMVLLGLCLTAGVVGIASAKTVTIGGVIYYCPDFGSGMTGCHVIGTTKPHAPK